MSDPSVEAPPTCYRHPDRETYVRCTRCDRPICPDCMTAASVGFQCPECVREGNKSVRRTVTTFGGRAQRRPGVVTQVLIGLNVVAFLFQGVSNFAIGGGRENAFTLKYELLGCVRFPGGPCLAGVGHGEYYRLLTAAFLHSGLLHIALNMYALYLLGTQLERVLGTWRYLTLYLLCGVGGNTLSYVVHGAGTRSLGASTAVYGLFAAFYLVVRRLGGDTGQIVLLIGVNFVITFTFPIIDKFGHIGGLVTGLVVGLVLTRVSPRKAWLQYVLMAAVGVALVSAAVVRTGTLT